MATMTEKEAIEILVRAAISVQTAGQIMGTILHSFWVGVEDEPEQRLSINGITAVVSASSGGYSGEVKFPDGSGFTHSSVTSQDEVTGLCENAILNWLVARTVVMSGVQNVEAGIPPANGPIQ